MNKNISNQFIEPYKSKNAFIQSQIIECQNKNLSAKKIIILQPSKGFPSKSNIGIFSQTTDMASSWVPVPSVNYVLKGYDLFPRDISLQENVSKDNLNTCIIDLEQYSQTLSADSEIPKS